VSARLFGLALAIACAISLGDAVAQGGGGGGGKGGGDGRQRAGGDERCGSELVVVLPDGRKRQYASVAEFFEGFKSQPIDQGEDARQAVPVDAVLQAHSADWMEALDCNNRSLHLPSGMPFEGRDYLVMTGKRGLKAVREVRPKAYANTLSEIRKLTLHKATRPQAAPARK